MILTLQTTTFGAYGGIPAYNRLVCRVLNELSEAQQSPVLIATDKPSDTERAAVELGNLSLQGFDQNRAALGWRLIQLALSHKFDLALIGHVNYASLGWLLKQVQPKLRYGVMLYGIEAWEQLPGLKRRALQQADFMISISEYTKQKAVQANSLNPERIYLLPNALEWTGSVPESTAAQVTRFAGTRLLSVCRLEQAEQYKGVDKVIEVLPQVAERVPDVQYIVVGGGTDLARHQALAEKLGVAERVHFLGYLADDDLRGWYRDCDLFVMPSAGEGFGFVFLEAMKYGKAVVAANSGGAPEVVQDGLTGKLVEYGDRQDLAQTLIGLCLDRDARQRLGEAGHARLLEKFTFAHFNQTLSEILARELPANVVSDYHFRPSGAPTEG